MITRNEILALLFSATGVAWMALWALWDIARHLQRIAVALEALKGG